MKVQQPLIIYSQNLGIPENTATRRNLIPEKLSFERTFSPSRCFRLLYFSTLLSAELRTEIMIQVNNSEWHYQQNTAMARNWTKAADSLVVIWVDERKLVAFHFHPYKTTTRNLHQEHRRLCWAPKSTMTTTTESRDVLNGCAVGCCSVFRRTDGFTLSSSSSCVYWDYSPCTADLPRQYCAAFGGAYKVTIVYDEIAKELSIKITKFVHCCSNCNLESP